MTEASLPPLPPPWSAAHHSHKWPDLYTASQMHLYARRVTEAADQVKKNQYAVAHERLADVRDGKINISPVAYRLPKAGINNGYSYLDSLDGKEPRFGFLWEPLYTEAKLHAMIHDLFPWMIDRLTGPVKVEHDGTKALVPDAHGVVL